MELNKMITEPSYEKQLQSYIKLHFAEFNYKLHTKEYKAEFLDKMTAPPPLYDDIECVKNGSYICCKREDRNDEFYSWFVTSKKENMPLLVVFPGYDAKLRSYPDVSDKYNLLFISPLGYSTPHRINTNKIRDKNTWPVLYNTLCGFEGGYKDWIMDALTVIKFIEDENLADTDKLIFAGTSQGGAMALIFASYFGQRCIATCSDLPFLIGYSTHRLNDVIYEFPPPPDIPFKMSDAERRLSIVDPKWHASRLKMPVLITSSDIDEDCPEKDITSLYHQIPENTIKKHIKYHNRVHGYSSEFFKDMMEFLDKLK